MSDFIDVRERGFPSRTEVPVAQALIQAHTPAPRVERGPVRLAAGRVLAADVVAPCDVPGFDRSAFDGYAVQAESTFGAEQFAPRSLLLLGDSMPGRPCHVRVDAGEVVRIMTGAPIPAGADAVVPFELADERDGIIEVRQAVPPGKNIGRRGEDIRQGQTILTAGRRLRPQDLGVLTSLGISEVELFARPRVLILVTGDEILPAGSVPAGYSIVDSNSPMLAALIERDGGEPPEVRYLPDGGGLLRGALQSPGFDLVFVSGGSSVGREDHAPWVVADLGELLVHGMALRPASPAGFGLVGGRLVFLMPGNPVSCLCAYDLFARLAVQRLAGRAIHWPYPQERLPLLQKIASAVGRLDYVRVRCTPEGVEPLGVSGASMLSGAVRADGFVLVEADREGHAAGEAVTVYRYDAPTAGGER